MCCEIMLKYARSQNVVKREIAGEIFLVPVKQKLADMQNLFVLHGSGELIWNSLDDTPSQQALVDVICESYDVSCEDAGKDVDSFLSALLEAELIKEVE